MTAGARSLLASWIGGAGAGQKVGPRSFLAFWMGGAANPQPIPPSPPPPPLSPPPSAGGWGGPGEDVEPRRRKTFGWGNATLPTLAVAGRGAVGIAGQATALMPPPLAAIAVAVGNAGSAALLLPRIETMGLGEARDYTDEEIAIMLLAAEDEE